MAELNWVNEFSVQVESLDFHHKKIFDLITKYRKSIEKNKLNTKKILDELMKYTEYHLHKEETYFEKFTYKKKESHIKLHNNFRKKVYSLIEKEKFSKSDKYKLLTFLEEWWIHHILYIDKQYSKHFNNNGLY